MRLPLSPSLSSLASACALLCASGGALAAAPSTTELQQLLDKLSARMERLEQRNAELERQLQASGQPAAKAAPAVDLEKRVQALEVQQTHTSTSLERETISENEPELTSRLKAVEVQAQHAQSAARKIEALSGLSAGFSLTTMAQKPYGMADTNSQLNYRADAYVSLPLDNIGDVEQKLYTQVRIGQGAGLNDLASFSKPNATAFRVLGGLRPDDSVAVLAQAWYQASIPLPFGGYRPHSREMLEVNFGKMDPFAFFDQNAAANDETRQFVNTIFVHNPLLDAGGDIGVDANGFTPGLRLSYLNTRDKPENWRLSFGVFGAGDKGSNYQRSLSSPLLMLQAETQQRLLTGLPGNYRIYTWRNAAASNFALDDDSTEVHSGWGLSVDQRLGDGLTVFGRYGQQMQGHVRFDKALTLGTEINGAYWSRGGDSLGLALGLLKTSRDYRDLYAASTPAGNGERVAELYYRWRIGKQFELSPNLQYIAQPAGIKDADAVKILGVRAQLSY